MPCATLVPCETLMLCEAQQPLSRAPLGLVSLDVGQIGGDRSLKQQSQSQTGGWRCMRALLYESMSWACYLTCGHTRVAGRAREFGGL